jgi:hypothetical protein
MTPSYFDPPDKTQSVSAVAKPQVVAGRVGDNAVDLCERLIRELESIRLDAEADARDWQQVAKALGLPASTSREQIVQTCRMYHAANQRPKGKAKP